MMTEMISRKYGNDGYEVIIKTDSHEHYKSAEEFARRIIDHAKPMTNADRIRAMSDEELLNFLWSFDVDKYSLEDNCGNIGICTIRKLEEWLKQPVGGANHV